jgi:hypothetical protein
MDQKSLPNGFLDVFAVAQLPSTHPKAFVERGGKAIRTTTEQGFLCYGQYKKGYPLMPLQAVFSILIDNNTTDDRYILIVDVYDHNNDRVIGKQLITRKDFPKANEFCLFSFDFTPPSPQANMEFRIYYMGFSYVLANKIAVIDPAKISLSQASEIPEIGTGPVPPTPAPVPPQPEPELPKPWKVKAIGNGSGKVTLRQVVTEKIDRRKGEVEYEALFDIEANGAIRNYADDFYFLYQEWSEYGGPGLTGVKFTLQEGFVGVMFRESLDPDARFLMIEKHRFVYRATRGGKIMEKIIDQSGKAINGALLVRAATNQFQGKCRTGATGAFSAVATFAFEMPRKVYLGLAAGTSKAKASVGVRYRDPNYATPTT